MGKSLNRYLSPTGVEVWRNVKCQKWGGGCIWFIDLNSLVRGGNSSKIKKNTTDFLKLCKPIRPKILHCAIECVTLCWSASEGLSPQLGKEASLLPSNTIHTLLTLPPTRPQSSSALPSWHPLSSYHIAPWVTMSGVTINACLLLALTKHHRLSLSSLCLLGQLRLGDALMHHHQKTTTPAEEVIVEAGRAQCTNTPICSLDQCILLHVAEEKHC